MKNLIILTMSVLLSTSLIYAQPDVLVSTDWVNQHRNDPNLALVEVDANIATYNEGHIPGAKNIPWSKACNDDGTFKSVAELQALYFGKGVTADKNVIAYCRIGERSSHTWFVLKYLLGYPHVSNYDGSWTEWGNLVGAPVVKGT